MTSVMTALKLALPADAIKTSGFSVEPETGGRGGVQETPVVPGEIEIHGSVTVTVGIR